MRTFNKVLNPVNQEADKVLYIDNVSEILKTFKSDKEKSDNDTMTDLKKLADNLISYGVKVEHVRDNLGCAYKDTGWLEITAKIYNEEIGKYKNEIVSLVPCFYGFTWEY